MYHVYLNHSNVGDGRCGDNDILFRIIVKMTSSMIYPLYRHEYIEMSRNNVTTAVGFATTPFTFSIIFSGPDTHTVSHSVIIILKESLYIGSYNLNHITHINLSNQKIMMLHLMHLLNYSFNGLEHLITLIKCL